MARIRTIKPEFWTDPDIVAMPMAARLFFIGCWNHADDYGVLRDDPERLRLQIMPADDIDVEAIVNELVDRRHLVRMVAQDGTKVLVVRTFGVHQKIDRRAAGRWGEPADFQPIPTTPAESPPIPTNPHQGREGKGRERNGGEGKTNTSTDSESSTTLTVVEPGSSPPATAFDLFYAKYPRKVGKPKAKDAFKRALKRATVTEITDGLDAHLPAWESLKASGNESKIPHPTTWINRDGWGDDPPPIESGARTIVPAQMVTTAAVESNNPAQRAATRPGCDWCSDGWETLESGDVIRCSRCQRKAAQ